MSLAEQLCQIDTVRLIIGQCSPIHSIFVDEIGAIPNRSLLSITGKVCADGSILCADVRILRNILESVLCFHHKLVTGRCRISAVLYLDRIEQRITGVCIYVLVYGRDIRTIRVLSSRQCQASIIVKNWVYTTQHSKLLGCSTILEVRDLY